MKWEEKIYLNSFALSHKSFTFQLCVFCMAKTLCSLEKRLSSLAKTFMKRWVPSQNQFATNCKVGNKTFLRAHKSIEI